MKEFKQSFNNSIEIIEWTPDELEKKESIDKYIEYKDYNFFLNNLIEDFCLPEKLNNYNPTDDMLINVWLGGEKGMKKVSDYADSWLTSKDYCWAGVAKAALGDFDFAEKLQIIENGFDGGNIGTCVIKNDGIEPAKRILKVIIGRNNSCGGLEFMSERLAKLGEKETVNEMISYFRNKNKETAEELSNTLDAYSGNIDQCIKTGASDFHMGIAYAKNNRVQDAENILQKLIDNKQYLEAEEIALLLNKPHYLRSVYPEIEKGDKRTDYIRSTFNLNLAKKIKGIRNEVEEETPKLTNLVKSFTLKDKEDLISKAICLNDKKFIKQLGYILTEEERFKIMEDENIPREFRALLDLGKIEYEDFEKLEEKDDIFDDTRIGLKKALEQDNTNNDELVKYLTEILYKIENQTSDNVAKDVLLNEFRGVGIDHPQMARLAKTLAQLDSLKAKDLIVQIMGDKRLPRQYTLYFLKKLISEGYLDKNLNKYLKAKREELINSSSEEKIEQEEYLKKVIESVVTVLHINPDADVLKLILDKDWGTKVPGEIINKIYEMRHEFEAILDKDELVNLLANDKHKATVYYFLYGGKTHFELVNSYNSDKFNTILDVVNKLKYNEGPIKKFKGVLDDSLNKEEVMERLKKGKYPFGEVKFVKEIRIDVSDSERYEALERESKEIFGNGQIGVILKYNFYLNKLDGVDIELFDQLKNINGLTDAETILDQVDSKYPNLNKELELELFKSWKKIGEKNILSLSLTQVLLEKENSINFNDLIKNLEVQRKALMSTVRQQYNSGNIEKIVRDEKLEALEEKGKAKLLKYILQEVVTIEEPSDKLSLLLSEWESHLEGAFENYQDLRNCKNKEINIKKEKRVTVRYLDKREDLISSLRFADSAQCCFTSTSYRLEGHNVGNAEWIARLWKDPMSFIFQIEDNESNSERREAVGFVFGSFGIENNKMVVLLNGVYMKNKTDIAAESILKTIEDNFSRSFNVNKQVVASRHGGTTKMPMDYSNSKLSIERLRGISDHSGKPETKIYDDLNVGVNEANETDNNVWHKELK